MDSVELARHLPMHADSFRILVILRSGERHGYAIVKELARAGDLVDPLHG